MEDATPPSKACSTCGETKLLEEFSFDRRHADGRQSQCRACTKARQKKYKEENKERYLELRRAEHQRRKPKIKVYVRANRERINAQAKKRRKALEGEALERFREQRRASATTYRLKFPEECSERIVAWRKANPGKVAEYVHIRRLRQYENGEYERFSRKEIGERDGWMCGICSSPIDPAARWPDHMSASLDHIVPLSHGGPHTRANSRIAHWICNVRRGASRESTHGSPPIDSAA